MSDAELTVPVGEIKAQNGALQIQFEARAVVGPRQPYVRIRAYDPDDRRRDGTFLWLSLEQFEELKQLVLKADRVVGRVAAQADLINEALSD